MRKSEKTTFQWPKVIKLLITIPCHRPDFRTGLRFSFWAPEVTILRVRKGHFHCFSSLQKSPFRCLKRKRGFLAFSHFIQGFSSFYLPDKIHFSQKRKDFTKKCIKRNQFIAVTWFQNWLCILKLVVSFVCLLVYLFVCTSHFANFARGKWSNHDSKNCSEIRAVTPF